MPYDGNGVYNPVSPPLFPAVAGTTITANQYNQQILDMAAALSNCLTRDGQGKPNATINWNNQKLTNLAPGVANSDAVRLDQLIPAIDARVKAQLVLGNAVPLQAYLADGTTKINLLWVGSDNKIYLGYDSTTTNWWAQFDPSANQINFSKNTRSTGSVLASGNVGGFQ